jgi:hypothetical protein
VIIPAIGPTEYVHPKSVGPKPIVPKKFGAVTYQAPQMKNWMNIIPQRSGVTDFLGVSDMVCGSYSESRRIAQFEKVGSFK